MTQASPGRTLALRSSDRCGAELVFEAVEAGSWWSPAGAPTVTADIKNSPRRTTGPTGFCVLTPFAHIHRDAPGDGEAFAPGGSLDVWGDVC